MAAIQRVLETSLGTCGLLSEAFSWQLSAKSPSETEDRERRDRDRETERRDHLQVLRTWGWEALAEAEQPCKPALPCFLEARLWGRWARALYENHAARRAGQACLCLRVQGARGVQLTDTGLRSLSPHTPDTCGMGTLHGPLQSHGHPPI